MVLSKQLEDLKNKLIAEKKEGISSRTTFSSFRYNEVLKKEIEGITSFLDEFYSGIEIGQRIYHLRESLEGVQKCEICGNPRKFHRYTDGYFSTCGRDECKKQKKVEGFKSTLSTKYGGEYFKEGSGAREKYKKTMIERYGADHNLKSEELRENRKKTMISKYGHPSPLKNKEILEKRNKTCLEKYGTLNFITGEKAKKTNLKRYGSENPMGNPDLAKKVFESCSKTKQDLLREKLNLFQIDLIQYGKIRTECKCLKCNNEFSNHPVTINSKIRHDINPCPFCNPPDLASSKAEKELGGFIISAYSGKVETNYKKIFSGNKKFSEVDFYLPDLGIAFEYNGLYWHSEIYKDPKYHSEKSKYLLERGIRLYHIWEDDWIYKKEIIKSSIRNILGLTSSRISARKCKIADVPYREYVEFCRENHLKSYAPASVIIGLYYERELVCLVSFAKTRQLIESKNNLQEYEIIRSCTKINKTVIGGTSRIISKFREKFGESIVTYCDVSLSPNPENTVYIKSGMKYIKTTDPGFYWVIDGKRSNRLNWTKSKLINLGYDSKKTANEIMADLGAYKIWDSGNHKFSF